MRAREVALHAVAAIIALVLAVVLWPPLGHDGRAERTRRFMSYAEEAFHEHVYGRSAIPWNSKAEAIEAARLRVRAEMWRPFAQGMDA